MTEEAVEETPKAETKPKGKKAEKCRADRILELAGTHVLDLAKTYCDYLKVDEHHPKEQLECLRLAVQTFDAALRD